MANPDREWDFFLAHGRADTKTAEELYDYLAGSATVFLDTRSVELGDDWDRMLADVQRRSLVSVILVSSRSDSAYYEREEIASAIQMARDTPDSHRVIPVFLDPPPVEGERQIPYGLRLKQGLDLSTVGSVEGVAFRLLGVLKRLRYSIVLYNSRDGAAAHFRGRANSLWAGRGAEARRISPIGEGAFRVEPGGVLSVTRTTANGRMELQLFDHESSGPNTKRRVFPATNLPAGERRLWIHCEAQTDGGKHGLRFVLKNDETETWLASEKRVVESTVWTAIDVWLRIDSTREFSFRIDDEDVSQVTKPATLA